MPERERREAASGVKKGRDGDRALERERERRGSFSGNNGSEGKRGRGSFSGNNEKKNVLNHPSSFKTKTSSPKIVVRTNQEV